jgi:H+-translocating NAD(P) transhydrogenase subunit alpha
MVRARRNEEASNMLIGVALETAPGETRVAVTPETAKKLKAQGHVVRVQSQAGAVSSATPISMLEASSLRLARTIRCQ